MARGYLYLVAVIDWYRRSVLAWALSNTLESAFCVEALQAALALSEPVVFNTDPGAQLTSAIFTGRLKQRQIRISMDGRGRALDNVFTNRLCACSWISRFHCPTCAACTPCSCPISLIVLTPGIASKPTFALKVAV